MESPAPVHGLYLYCLTRAGYREASDGPGLYGQQPPLLTRVGDLAAIWSPVLLAEFCGEHAASRLQDLDWVGPRACRHEAVVEGVMRRSPVLPVRFGTIFSTWERLEQVLHEHHDAVVQFLDQVSDKTEWAVKGFLNRALAKQVILSRKQTEAAERLASLSPGHRYFQEQRLRREVEQELAHWAPGVCRRLLLELRSLASQDRARQILPVTDENRDQEMICNWAFLVAQAAVADFKARVDAAIAGLDRQGLVFVCTGPWPPYTFSPSLTTEVPQ
jgi:hypothetical protein